jgi:hypothetical protein
MPPARNFGLLTVVKQASEGTAMSDAATGYSFPIASGMIGPTKEWGDLPRQGTSLMRQGRYAQRAAITGTVTVLAAPEGLGLLLYLAMGTELALGAPSGGYTPHTFTIADAWPAPATVWASLASGSDADVWRFRDAYISRLRLAGESGGIVMVDMDFVAKHYTKTAAGAAGFPANYDDVGVLQPSEPRFKYIGSTVRLDSDSAVPVIMDNVESVSWEIDRSPEVRYGPSLTPTVLSPDRMVNFNASVMYDTGAGGSGATAFDKQGWAFMEDAFLSALAGDPDQSSPAGSFEVLFGEHPQGTEMGLRIVSGGGSGLPTTVAIDRNWEYETTRPEASDTPTLLSYDLNGVCRVPSAGTTESTIILNSQRATLYSA